MKIQYISDDGKIFTKLRECEDYETKIRKAALGVKCLAHGLMPYAEWRPLYEAYMEKLIIEDEGEEALETMKNCGYEETEWEEFYKDYIESNGKECNPHLT